MSMQSVKWYEGLFLRPHHFQQQERYLSEQQYRLLRLIRPHCWGVVNCEIDRARVKQHNINIDSMQIVFQDGTFCVLNNNAICKPRSFREFWNTEVDTLAVFIGIRKLFEHTSNLDIEENDVEKSMFNAKRYINRRDKKLVIDYLEGGEKEEVDFLTYNLKIFFSGEERQAEDFELIKIAEIRRNGAEPVVDENYISPSFVVAANPHLARELKGFLETIDGFDRVVSEMRNYVFLQQKQQSIGVKEQRVIALLQAVRRCRKSLRQVFDNPVSSPYDVNTLLVELIAELSVLLPNTSIDGETLNAVERSPAEYRHDDIKGSLIEKINLAIHLLNMLTKEPDVTIKLEYDGSYFIGELKEKISKNHRYILVVEAEISKEILENIIAPKIKVASRETMPVMIARSLSGAKLKKVSENIPEVMQKESASYFSIDFTEDVMRSVNENSNVAVFFDKAKEIIKAEILQINEKK